MRLILFSLVLALVPAACAQPVPQRVWTGPNVNLLGGPSPDGQWLSYVDSAELTVRSATETRRLTHQAAGSKEFAYFSVFAPDSKRVAYAWFNAEGFYELRTATVEPSLQRVDLKAVGEDGHSYARLTGFLDLGLTEGAQP